MTNEKIYVSSLYTRVTLCDISLCSSTGNMPLLDIKDPAKRASLVQEYVTAMKNVKQRNMVDREMKLTIGDELQTFFQSIVTKQAAEETSKELAPMEKTLTDINGALAAQRVEAHSKTPPSKTPPRENADTTFGVHRKQDVQLSMGNKVVRIDPNRMTLTVDDTE